MTHEHASYNQTDNRSVCLSQSGSHSFCSSTFTQLLLIGVCEAFLHHSSLCLIDSAFTKQRQSLLNISWLICPVTVGPIMLILCHTLNHTSYDMIHYIRFWLRPFSISSEHLTLNLASVKLEKRSL